MMKDAKIKIPDRSIAAHESRSESEPPSPNGQKAPIPSDFDSFTKSPSDAKQAPLLLVPTPSRDPADEIHLLAQLDTMLAMLSSAEAIFQPAQQTPPPDQLAAYQKAFEDSQKKYKDREQLFGFRDVIHFDPRVDDYIKKLSDAFESMPPQQDYADVLKETRDEPSIKGLADNLVRKQDFKTDLYGGDSTQNDFRLTSAYYALNASKQIQEGANGLQVLLYLALGRSQQAREVGHLGDRDFGRLRQEDGSHELTTYVASKAGSRFNANYEPYFDALFHSLNGKSGSEPGTDPDDPMTHMAIGNASRLLNTQAMAIYHATPSKIPELMERFSQEFSAMQNKNYPQDEAGTAELMKDLGSLHWLLAIATPFKRGSAAIGENMIRALLLAKGRTVEPFNTMPDLEAFTRSRTQFAADYPSMFAKQPTIAQK